MKRFIFIVSLLFYWEVDGRGGRAGGFRFRFTSRPRSTFRVSSGGSSRLGGRFGGISNTPSHPKWFTSAQPRKYSSLKPVVVRVNSNAKSTNYGTKFSGGIKEEKKRLSKRTLGLGMGAGFLAGTGIGFGSSLAAYSVYHRYMAYLQMKHNLAENNKLDKIEDHWDVDYYKDWYKRNKCVGGCVDNSHCEWGICECDEKYEHAFGKCWTKSPKMVNERLKIDPQSSPIECNSHDDCFVHDVNFVCSSNRGRCECRPNLQWNVKALECQVFLDVDCSRFNYSSPVSKVAKDAANKITARMKEKEKKDKEQKCIVSKCKPNLRKSFHFGDLENCYKTGCQVLPSCERGSGSGLIAYRYRGRATERHCDDVVQIYRVSMISSIMSKMSNPGELEDSGPKTTRTETPSESLTGSLLYQDFNDEELATLTKDSLDELFCRDIESFSEVFEIQEEKPPGSCPGLSEHLCAALHDSSTCSGGWSLNITKNEKTQLGYFSHWKYRNDADVVVVRAGCTFTSWTESDFTGKKAELSAGVKDRWVVLPILLQE